MKKIASLIFTLMTAATFAADLYVKEFGGGGAYATIGDAMAAASHGDRILIEPKAGNGRYIENIVIDKNLQLLTATNGSMYYVQGSVTIATNLPAGSNIVIDGMRITTAGITAGNSANVIHISVVNSYIDNGAISLGANTVSTIANNEINYSSTNTTYALDIRKGNIYGNYVSSTAFGIRVAADVASQDTLFVVGNRVRLTAHHNNTGFVGILWENPGQFFYISNNYIYSIASSLSTTATYNYSFIRISSFKSGTNVNEFNNILNNTMAYASNANMASVGGCTGILTVALNQNCNIFNNYVQYPASTPNTGRSGFNVNGSPQFGYNMVAGISAVNTGNASGYSNTYNSSSPFSFPSWGCPAVGSTTILTDAGHPDPMFSDLNLTRNDCGACGGSYNIYENYWMSGTSGSAKVHWLWAPRRVLQGGVINIKAEGHDR